jgi:hypothetical protein
LKGDTGAAGASGTNGISGYEIKTTAAPTGTAGGAAVTASCSSGKTVYGGGVIGGGVALRSSGPVASGTPLTASSWQVTFNGSTSASATVYAICGLSQ